MKLFVVFLFHFAFTASARTFYIKNEGGTGAGRSDREAWNYATLHKAALLPGDRVLFKRGEVFFGPLHAKNGVAYGAYGKGANPVISGMLTIKDWKPFTGAIYVVPLELPGNLNIVTLDDKPMGMGRFPNTGYLQYTGHQANISISGQYVASLPFNATGAEAVLRKVRWILDRHPVISHNKDLLSLSTSTPYGGALGYEAVDKNGFFIQNHLATLDKPGEWYYDKNEKKLYMVLNRPAPVVKAAVVDTLVDLTGLKDISFTHIDFEGSNTHGLSLEKSKNITLNGCRLYHHGQTGIYGLHTTGLTVTNSEIRDCLNSGIWVEWGGRQTTISNVTVANCGTIAGAGRSGDGAQQGIFISGNGTTISHCTVTNTGYNAIQFSGSNARIEHNYIDRFCLVKDDGAGIYTYVEEGTAVHNRVIRNNRIFHAQGAFDGARSYDYEAFGKAAGIYLDGNCHQTEVSGNNIGYGFWAGIFVHNNGQNQLLNNTIYGYPVGILLTAGKAGAIRNLVVSGNNCSSRQCLYIRLMEKDNPALFGRFERNCYPRSSTIVIDRQYPNGGGAKAIRLKEWKAFGLDRTSVE